MDLTEAKLPEITIKAAVLGIILAIVMAGANAYLGLFAGLTVSASIPASVISMGVLKLFKKHNILENNIVQTAASAGYCVASGTIFTLPALVIMDYWGGFNYMWVTIIAGFGGILGVLFTVPLRRAMIVEGKLKFPEGIATAEVLKTGERKSSDIGYIAKAAIVSALFKLGGEGLRLWMGVIEGAKAVGGTILYFGSNLSPALLSVGYIIGLNAAVLIFLGGFANWMIAIPICAAFQTQPVVDGHTISALEWARRIWSTQTRYIGVGGMLIGGLWTIFKLRKSILGGVTSGLSAYRTMKAGGAVVPRQERDMPMKWILILIIASVVPLFLVYKVFVIKVHIALTMALIMLVTGFVFSAVAAYMAGIVGSSNNPISGVTVATVLVSALLLLLLMGSNAKDGPPAAVIIGGVICCAAAIAGDNMQDLKAGYIVGSTPWKQQTIMIIGAAASALVMAPILSLLLTAYGFAGHSSAKAQPLIAAQANLMASVSKGVFQGGLPWDFVIIGIVVGAMTIAYDSYLERKGSNFRMPILAVAIGIYLPFELSVPIFAGGIIQHLIRRYHSKRGASEQVIEEHSHKGLLLASGLITGEALIGILLAIPIVIFAKSDILAVLKEPIGNWPGVVLLIAVAYWMYRTGVGKKQIN